MLPPREQALSMLHDATRDLIAAETTEEVCDITVEVSREILGNEFTGFHLFDEEGALVPMGWTGDVDRHFGGPPPTIRPGQGLVWQTLEADEPRCYNHLHENDGRQNPDTLLLAEMQLPVGDAGVLLVGSTTSDTFSPEELSLAGVLASNAGAAIESVRTTETLREREAELERQNERLEAFASVVSHDLRNPLSVAVGQLELEREDNDSARLEHVATALDRMNCLIDDLLALAREGRTVGEVRTVSPAAIAEQAWETVVTDGASLVTGETETVEADPDALTELFENLFRNSVEHGDGGPTIEVGSLPGEAGFFVEDDGPGIPREAYEEVFEYGYTTAEEGTGIGLAIVRAIAEGHGWRVAVAEGEDGGARFEFET